MTIEQLRALYATACQRVQETADTIEALTDTASTEDVAAAETAHTEAVAEAERTSTAVSQREAVARARGNVFGELMETVKVASLGETSAALYAVGGEYRRNM